MSKYRMVPCICKDGSLGWQFQKKGLIFWNDIGWENKSLKSAMAVLDHLNGKATYAGGLNSNSNDPLCISEEE